MQMVTNITFGITKTSNIGIFAQKKISKTKLQLPSCIKHQPVKKQDKYSVNFYLNYVLIIEIKNIFRNRRNQIIWDMERMVWRQRIGGNGLEATDRIYI